MYTDFPWQRLTAAFSQAVEEVNMRSALKRLQGMMRRLKSHFIIPVRRVREFQSP